MDAMLALASTRMLTLEDIGLSRASPPEAVKDVCDSIARALVSRYLDGSIGWSQADTIANHLYELMILHCGTSVPDYAWEVFIAFDEGEIDKRGDPFTRPRVIAIQEKYRAT